MKCAGLNNLACGMLALQRIVVMWLGRGLGLSSVEFRCMYFPVRVRCVLKFRGLGLRDGTVIGKHVDADDDVAFYRCNTVDR